MAAAVPEPHASFCTFKQRTKIGSKTLLGRAEKLHFQKSGERKKKKTLSYFTGLKWMKCLP